MSMFDNIILDEFTMLDEGKQADEYKRRKHKENNSEFVKNIHRAYRYSSSRMPHQHEEDNTDKHTELVAKKSISPELNYKRSTRKSKENLLKDIYAADAKDRHNRRHSDAKIESALMLIGGYESEFAY